jgi:hypothetical protein
MPKQSGSGLFTKTPEHIKRFKMAQKSEKELVKTYKKHVKASIKYTETYKKHMGNLKALDEMMPDGFESFAEIFKSRVMPDIRTTKKPDTTSPLMLKNYKVEHDVDKDDIAKRHLWQQCEYIRRTKFSQEDAVLISKLDIVNLQPTTFVMAVTGINFAKDNKRSIPHKNFTADLALVRSNMADVISIIKKDVLTEAVKNSVFSAPIKDDDMPLIASPLAKPGVASAPERKPPLPDIYGVKRFMNNKPAAPAKFGDNKPDFGAQRPKFEKPAYLQQSAQNNRPDRPGFEKPKPFGDFGADRPLKSPNFDRRNDRQHDRRNDRQHDRRNDRRNDRQHDRRNDRQHDRNRRPNFQARGPGSRRKRFGGNSGSRRRSKRNSRRGPPQPPGFEI